MAQHDTAANGTNRLLKGWKEIATFFGRDESTVRRWANATDFPVHRVPGRRRAAVYAYSHDLEDWLTRQRKLDTASEPVLAPTIAPKPEPRKFASSRMAAAFAVLVTIGILALIGWRLDVDLRDFSHYGPSAKAESLYLDGLYNLETRTTDGITRAIGLFSQATTEDPSYVKAYVGLADAYNLVSQYTTVPANQAYPRARAAAERAVALDPGEAGGYAALAFNTYYWLRDFNRSMELFEKAISLDPDNARAHHWYALVTMQNRRFDISMREIAIAQKLDPRAPSILANKGLILFHAGHTDEAIAILRPLAETEPSLLSPAAYLATIYLATGRDQDFLREFRRAAVLSGNQPEIAIADAAEKGFEDGGRPAMLSAMFAEQKHQYADDKMPAFKLALTAAMLGDDAVAFGYLDTSIRRGEPDILGIRLEPALAGLRKDSRFNVLVAEAGLSPESIQ